MADSSSKIRGYRRTFWLLLVLCFYSTIAAADTATFVYDDLNRLIQADYDHGTGTSTVQYQYDSAGNMTRVISSTDYVPPPPDSDGDGTADDVDAFPDDPAASVDSDGDGSPDAWNPGMSAEDSTTGLSLDAFPTDPAASLDEDGDGSPDAWNVGMTSADSTTGLVLDHFPGNPSRGPYYAPPAPVANQAQISGNVTLRGVPAAAGTVIAVFDAQGVLCGHDEVDAAGQYGPLSVYGDDVSTSLVDEGAVDGDVLSFRLWDPVEERELFGQVALAGGGTLVQWSNGTSLSVDLDGRDTGTVTVPLVSGWNLISVPCLGCWYWGAEVPDVPLPPGASCQPVASIDDVLGSIAGQYEIVRSSDEAGAHTYAASLPPSLNDLEYLSGGYGYWIKMTEAAFLQVECGGAPGMLKP